MSTVDNTTVYTHTKEALYETMYMACQIFYMRAFHFSSEEKLVTLPSLSAIRDNVQWYCTIIQRHLCPDITDTPLWKLYKTWLLEEDLLHVLSDILEELKVDEILEAINPEKTMPDTKEYFVYNDTVRNIMDVPNELVAFTAFQFLSYYLYHNTNIRISIESRKIYDKFYLNTDPTNIISIQNPIPHSQTAFSVWIYKKCPHVMDTVEFITGACYDKGILSFKKGSLNKVYDIHFGMYVR